MTIKSIMIILSSLRPFKYIFSYWLNNIYLILFVNQYLSERINENHHELYYFLYQELHIFLKYFFLFIYVFTLFVLHIKHVLKVVLL